jgi:hypothetical protein
MNLRVAFSTLLFACLMMVGGILYSPVPKEIKPHLISSMIEKESIVKIPGRAASPSIVECGNGYLLAAISQKKERFQTKKWRSKERPTQYSIILTKLDNNFHGAAPSQELHPKEASGVPLFHVNHVALVVYQGKLWLFYSDSPSPEVLNLYAAPVYEYIGKWILGTAIPISCPSARWIPTVIQEGLYLFSDKNPLACLELDLASGTTTEISEANIHQLWPFGTIHSHCPTIKTKLGLVGFFHSIFKGVYCLGAWSPSFNKTLHIPRISKQPIGSPKFYSYWTNKKRQIEPCGVIEKGDHLIVSCLVDGKVHIVRMNTADLFAHLQEA